LERTRNRKKYTCADPRNNGRAKAREQPESWQHTVRTQESCACWPSVYDVCCCFFRKNLDISRTGSIIIQIYRIRGDTPRFSDSYSGWWSTDMAKRFSKFLSMLLVNYIFTALPCFRQSPQPNAGFPKNSLTLRCKPLWFKDLFWQLAYTMISELFVFGNPLCTDLLTKWVTGQFSDLVNNSGAKH
jgi:hypothetical protein